MCSRYIFGVQIPFQQVFGCLMIINFKSKFILGDYVDCYSYVPLLCILYSKAPSSAHMSYGRNLVLGERTSQNRVGPYRFCSGGTPPHRSPNSFFGFLRVYMDLYLSLKDFKFSPCLCASPCVSKNQRNRAEILLCNICFRAALHCLRLSRRAFFSTSCLMSTSSICTL